MWSKEKCLKTTHKVIVKKTKAGKIYKKTIKVRVEDEDKMEKHLNTINIGRIKL